MTSDGINSGSSIRETACIYRNMWKVSLVGHSQLPEELSMNNVEIQIYRAPGGRADNFFDDERLNDVLNWEHDLCLLWLGSNDIDNETRPRDIANNIIEVIESIEENCQAVVWICLVEPRFYTDGFMTEEDYRKVQRKIYKILKEQQITHYIPKTDLGKKSAISI